MAANVISYGGWTFLPPLVTGWLQSLYYSITIRAGDPKPQPGSPRHDKHRRRIQIAVIAAYLLYTIYEADYRIRQEGDFFTALGLPYDSDEKKIKSRFRRLAAVYHPDKLNTDSPTALEEAELHFVTLKNAQDTLIDPVKRYAYERFGAEILTWQHVAGIREYLTHGLMAVHAPLYGGTIAFMILLSFTTYFQAGRFWRFACLGLLLILEMHTVSRPYLTPILTKLINPVLEHTSHGPILPFQLLILARKLTFTLFIAFSQLSSLFPQAPVVASAATKSPQEMQQLARLEQTARASESDASRLLAMDMAPFMGDEQGTKDLKGKIREWLVNNTIRSDPEVRDAMGRVLGRRKTAGQNMQRV